MFSQKIYIISEVGMEVDAFLRRKYNEGIHEEPRFDEKSVSMFQFIEQKLYIIY